MEDHKAEMAAQPEEPTIPRRVSVNPRSPYYWPHYRRLRVLLDGEERHGDVEEFDIKAGWCKLRVWVSGGLYQADRQIVRKVRGRVEVMLIPRR